MSVAIQGGRRGVTRGAACKKLAASKIARNSRCKPRLSWTIHVDLYEARVISIPEPRPHTLVLPPLPSRFVPFVPVSIVSRFEIGGRRGRRAARASRDYRRDRGHGGFPEIIRKSPPVVPTCVRSSFRCCAVSSLVCARARV